MILPKLERNPCANLFVIHGFKEEGPRAMPFDNRVSSDLDHLDLVMDTMKTCRKSKVGF
jgi:phosphoketolase